MVELIEISFSVNFFPFLFFFFLVFAFSISVIFTCYFLHLTLRSLYSYILISRLHFLSMPSKANKNEITAVSQSNIFTGEMWGSHQRCGPWCICAAVVADRMEIWNSFNTRSLGISLCNVAASTPGRSALWASLRQGKTC